MMAYNTEYKKGDLMGGALFDTADVFVSGIGGVIDGLQASLRTVGDVVVKWHARSVQRRHLMELDDRLLADMGMDRVDARNEGDKPFWRA